MKEIFKLVLKYQFTIIFILLEIFAFSLVITHNNYQRTVFSGYMSSLMNSVSTIYINIHDYFHLRTSNQSLIEENIRLKNQIEEYKTLQQVVAVDTIWKNIDSVDVNFLFKGAKMVNSSVNKTKNYIIIDKGSLDGVQKEMAITSNDGVVGIIEKVSKHYAKIIPLINTNLRISAKIQKNGYYGSLQWDGVDYRYSYLNDIPFHVNVEVGDTIVTSGFSAIFPAGELIGFVESINKKTANFLSIKVKLATDFKRISDVYIIAHTKQEELQEL